MNIPTVTNISTHSFSLFFYNKNKEEIRKIADYESIMSLMQSPCFGEVAVKGTRGTLRLFDESTKDNAVIMELGEGMDTETMARFCSAIFQYQHNLTNDKFNATVTL